MVVFVVIFGITNAAILIFRKQIACGWSKEIIKRLKEPQNLADRIFGSAWAFDSNETIQRKLRSTLFLTGLVNLIGLVVILVCLLFFGDRSIDR